MAVVRRLEVLWRSRQKRFQVTLGDVGESNHLLIHLNYTTTLTASDAR